MSELLRTASAITADSLGEGGTAPGRSIEAVTTSALGTGIWLAGAGPVDTAKAVPAVTAPAATTLAAAATAGRATRTRLRLPGREVRLGETGRR
ncbi:hypothetical protein [Parafrankia elaeagni]|uniref:hypothetical protein n=1 Tax=Parafrankia elaeagni TaxID=222534 RepID=UPI00036DF6C2|nr:hypothetical protein [Parafrankia elaeagni]